MQCACRGFIDKYRKFKRCYFKDIYMLTGQDVAFSDGVQPTELLSKVIYHFDK